MGVDFVRVDLVGLTRLEKSTSINTDDRKLLSSLLVE